VLLVHDRPIENALPGPARFENSQNIKMTEMPSLVTENVLVRR
jgi:hypothetical protein